MPIADQTGHHEQILTVDAGNIDRVMLLAIWMKYLEKYKKKKIIFAAMGNPTFPIHKHIVSAELMYWTNVLQKSQEAHDLIDEMHHAITIGNEIALSKYRDNIVKIKSAISYSDPSGNIDAREVAAHALNKWYPGLTAKGENILLPVGGSSGLYSIFHFVNKFKDPNGVMVTAFPFYSLYRGNEGQNKLHPIHVMNQPGYKLTQVALQASLEVADIKNITINAYLFCDPNNPLGTVTDEIEWIKIAALLRQRLANEKDLPLEKKTPIVLDEAYAELGFKTPHSLLTVLMTHAPELLDHVILMRSATKGLSAAGERMALLYSRNQAFIKKCLTPGLNIYGHMPISAHASFSAGLDALNKYYLNCMVNFYKPQLDLVYQRAHNIGINMPDENYKPEGTFYILLDLHELIGTSINKDATAAVGIKKLIETDEDICYHLLFEESLLICPTSYFGIDARRGFVRVTCSGGDTELNLIMDKLSDQVCRVRKAKYIQLLVAVKESGGQLKKAIAIKEAENETKNNGIDSSFSDMDILNAENLKAEINQKVCPHKNTISEKLATGQSLKIKNAQLIQLLEKTQAAIRTLNPEVQKAYEEKRLKSGIAILRTYRKYRDNEKQKKYQNAQENLLRAYEQLKQATQEKYGVIAPNSPLVLSRQKSEKTVVHQTIVSSICQKN
ncbi:MAG: aminotransferase class I/II-fold pyridoxal phosphate-dependent enzyme [Legionellales bacterium]